MRFLNPFTSVSFSFLYILILALSFLLNCQTKNNKNKQLALAAAFFALNNSSSSCDAGIVSSNFLTQSQAVISSREGIDCNEISNFKFDSRVFSPVFNLNTNQLSFENTIIIPQAGNSILIPVKTVLFDTSRSIVLDSVGYKTNSNLYNYTEYRVILLNKNGKFTGIEASSEISAEQAFKDVFQKCQQEF